MSLRELLPEKTLRSSLTVVLGTAMATSLLAAGQLCTPNTALAAQSQQGSLKQEQVCNHVWKAWVHSPKYTCTTDGFKTRSCYRCNAVEREVTKAVGHNWSGIDGNCRNCGKEPASLLAATGKSLSTWEKEYASRIEKAMSQTKTSLVLPGKGAPIEAYWALNRKHNRMREAGLSRTGRLSQADTDALLRWDRLGVQTTGYNGYVIDQETGIRYVKEITINYMFSRQEVAKAERICKKVATAAKRKGSTRARMQYIHDWIVNNSVYLGMKSSKWKSPAAYGYKNSNIYGGGVCQSGGSTLQLLTHNGVCWNYSLTFGRLCKAAGIKNIRIVKAPNHAFNAYKTSDGWRYVDATWDDPHNGKGWELGVCRHTYFLCTKKGLGNYLAHQF